MVFGNIGGDLAQSLFSSGDENDVGAAGRQPVGKIDAESGGSSGNKGGSVVEIAGDGRSLSIDTKGADIGGDR